MINTEELRKEIGLISYDILDNIVSPICGIGGIVADLYLSDISTYTADDDYDNRIIFESIAKNYQLTEDQGFSRLDAYSPIAFIALYIVLNSPIYTNQPPEDLELGEENGL